MESLADTDPEAARVQADLLRRASPAKRLSLGLSLSRAVLGQGARELGVADLLARALAASQRH